MHLSNLLQTGLQDLHLPLSEAIQTQLLDYVHLLSKWNRIYNLTAIRDEVQMIPKHLLDSLAVLPYICGTQILDVGTGAGLPGLLLAIARPDWQCVLLDSNAKKIRFLRQAIVELKMTNVEVVHSRIEDYQLNSATAFTTIISRAYTRLYDFYQQTVKLCATDGCLVAMKGSYPDLEIVELRELSVPLEVVSLFIPQLEAPRHLVRIHPAANVSSPRGAWEREESPFNVGTSIELHPFTQDQVADLVQRHSLVWKAETMATLMTLVGGHPYLVQVALSQIAQGQMTLEQLLKGAAYEEGPYADRLRRHRVNLEEHPELAIEAKKVMTSPYPCPVREVKEVFKLRSMGLVKLENNEVMPLCDWYRRYFGERL